MRFRTARTVVALLTTALTAAGCGSGTQTVVERTVTETVPDGTTAATAPASTPQPNDKSAMATTTEATTTTKRPSTAPIRTRRLTSFRTPTGNIGCILLGGTARCDIDKRQWSPPARPAACSDEVYYGQGLEVTRSGRGRVVCAGDTARDPSAPVLAYRTAAKVGPLRCVSRTSGVTCTNGKGHGFTISVQRYRLF